MPPSSDTLAVHAAEARALFRVQASDTVSAVNFRPYEIVADMARELLRSLGRDGMAQAIAIESVLDSLGLETAVRVDPEMPHFVLVSVRNPDRATAMAVGFVFWYRGRIYHQQGILLPSGREPQLRVWHTGRTEHPYSLCVLDRARDGALSWVLLGLSSAGDVWDIVQSVDRLGDEGRGRGAFADVNGDGLPELVLWTRSRPDSLVTVCRECPGLIDETMFVERREGFVLQDSRLLPTPLSTFTLFVRYLQNQNRAGAARLLVEPRRLDEALALGWGARRAPGTWAVEYAEPDEQWPRWLAIRFRDAKRQLYIVHFELKAGRWVIHDWLPVRPPSTAPAPPPTPAGGGAKR